MSAKSSGGTASRLRAKNAAMAAAMKAAGIKRSSCLCPMCHAIVSLSALYGHLGKCK